MAIRFEQCVDTAHAVACCEAGILYLNMGAVGTGQDWVLNDPIKNGPDDIEHMHGTNRNGMWPPSEFAICVED